MRQPNRSGRLKQDSLCDGRIEDQSKKSSGITEVKLVMIRAEDKRQIKKKTQIGTWNKMLRTVAESKSSEEFPESYTNYGTQ